MVRYGHALTSGGWKLSQLPFIPQHFKCSEICIVSCDQDLHCEPAVAISVLAACDNINWYWRRTRWREDKGEGEGGIKEREGREWDKGEGGRREGRYESYLVREEIAVGDGEVRKRWEFFEYLTQRLLIQVSTADI